MPLRNQKPFLYLPYSVSHGFPPCKHTLAQKKRPALGMSSQKRGKALFRPKARKRASSLFRNEVVKDGRHKSAYHIFALIWRAGEAGLEPKKKPGNPLSRYERRKELTCEEQLAIPNRAVEAGTIKRTKGSRCPKEVIQEMYAKSNDKQTITLSQNCAASTAFHEAATISDFADAESRTAMRCPSSFWMPMSAISTRTTP